MKGLLVLALLLCAATVVCAQNSVLRGVVTDESGAVVPGATVALSGPGVERTTTSGTNGAYTFVDLPAGDYTVRASAPQLTLPQPRALTIRGGVQTLNLRLTVASTTQQIVVEEDAGPSVSTDAANNAAATVLRGNDLDSLSDNPEDMQADLQALAGPSAGPGGGSIYIDGFSGGELPPKESITTASVRHRR